MWLSSFHWCTHTVKQFTPHCQIFSSIAILKSPIKTHGFTIASTYLSISGKNVLSKYIWVEQFLLEYILFFCSQHTVPKPPQLSTENWVSFMLGLTIWHIHISLWLIIIHSDHLASLMPLGLRLALCRISFVIMVLDCSPFLLLLHKLLLSPELLVFSSLLPPSALSMGRSWSKHCVLHIFYSNPHQQR